MKYYIADLRFGHENVIDFKSLCNPGPALFYCVNGNLLFHSCSIAEGEPYGIFINYPYSHYNIWMEKYYQEYKVDFDYYPRGRIVYRKTDNTFLIYYDRCMESQLDKIIDSFQNLHYELNYDEHYQCHTCNKEYVR